MLMPAGDCLKYGLTRELARKDVSNHGSMHFKAFLVYFTLMGYIDEISYNKIIDLFTEFNAKKLNSKELFQFVMKVLVPRLQKYILFENSEEMYERLNSIEIPDWIYDSMNEISCFLPRAYLLDECIYYILSDNDIKYFRCVHWKNSMDMTNSGLVGEAGANDLPNFNISISYESILGVDRVNKIIYLKPIGSDQLYAEYLVEEDEVIIRRDKCLGVLADERDIICPIVEKDGNIVAMIDCFPHIIEKSDSLKKYEIKEGKIHVDSYDRKLSYIKPYFLNVHGDREELTYRENAKHLINDIWMDVRDNPRFLVVLEGKGPLERFPRIDEDTIISIDYLAVFFEFVKDTNKEKEILYRELMRLLSKYYKSNEDLLDLFYVFADTSRKMSEPGEQMGILPMVSARLVYYLKKLQKKQKLGLVIKKPGECEDLLLNEAFCGCNKAELCETNRKSPLIGYFEWSGNKLASMSYELEKGGVFGDLIMVSHLADRANERMYHGMVAFNYSTGEHVIQYNRPMTKDEKACILDSYNILDSYRFVVADM